MGIALLALSSFSHPVRALGRLLARGTRAAPRHAVAEPPRPTAPPRVPARVARPAANAERFAPVAPVACAARTVRVLHGSRPGEPGRLVISGRMADVCAELDRLAAREA